MATLVSTMQNSRLRAMLLPREHGAWGMLLVPLATGAVVAAGSAFRGLPLAFFVIAALSLFWLRTPVEAWLGTSAIKAHSRQERVTVVNLMFLPLAVAIAAIAILFVRGYWRGLLGIGAVAALSFALQAAVKRRGRRARIPAQIIGAVGLTSTAAGAYYVASGHLSYVAFTLWAANWLFAANQVHFVQLRIHAGRLSTVLEKIQQGRVFLVGQVVLLAGVAALSLMRVFPKLTLLAFIPAIARGTLWFFRGQQ